MVSVTHYPVSFVAGSRVTIHRHRGAPGDSWMCSFGKKRGAQFAIRYFPSKKAWIALDIRKAVETSGYGRNGQKWWVGQKRIPRQFPTEDAAVVYVIAVTATQPELDLAS